MQKLIWPAAFIVCAVVGMFLFKSEISAMISRISTIDRNDIYLKELGMTELSDVYLVDNQETKNGFGGPGIQVVHRDKGKFLLMAFGVEPDPCHPAKGATIYR